ESWHHQLWQKNWIKWCKKNLSYLAQKFLDEFEENRKEMIRNFFGCWFDIEGKKQTGYYLGHEIIKFWEEEVDFKEIAMMNMNDIDKKVKNSLEKISVQTRVS
ncbi:MAG: hypothetical protein ACTSVL_04935, partial [Promethearchaeota archaeon]